MGDITVAVATAGIEFNLFMTGTDVFVVAQVGLVFVETTGGWNED
jgi:hypothetical protein